jgi:cellulase (glycosyl hydrolase family 5)
MRSIRERGHTSRRRTVAAFASAVVLAVSLGTIPAYGDSAPEAAGPLQVLPGHLIGADYEPNKFYVRQGDGAWELTYTPGWQGSGFSEQVRGTLLNLRSANGVYDDESGKIKDYDPDFTAEANTDAFIANLDSYKANGLIATDVNLQGGNPGFDGSVNPAYNGDGSLREEWMARVAKVIEAHAQRNMVVVLGLFYFHQDHVLESEDAVRAAVTNVADWLIAKDYRNVVIEIANEYNADSYEHEIIHSDEGEAELINLAKSRFDNAPFRLAVSTSRQGDGSWPSGPMSDAADLALIHCNGLDAAGCAGAAGEHVQNYPYPIVVNETDNTKGEYTDDTLAEDNATIDQVTAAGASWGLMHNQWNQYAACVYNDDCGSEGFDWALGSDPGPNGSGAELLRNYAAGVFAHLKSVVFQ